MRTAARELMAFAVTLAQGMPRLERLIAAVIEEARKRRVLLPSPRAIDLLCQQARVRSERLLYKALTSGMSDVTKKSLDGLLELVPDTAMTRLTWLRNASQSPAPANILGLIERIQFVRKLGVDAERRQAIPSGAFDRIARDAMKMTVQHLAECGRAATACAPKQGKRVIRIVWLSVHNLCVAASRRISAETTVRTTAFAPPLPGPNFFTVTTQ